MVLVVALGILTRTQFGRDILKGQVERSFNRAFEGELSIGQLQGNLVQDLFASDVQLLDPNGDLVLSADSIALRPHWRSLFRNAFIADEIELFSPVAHLVQDSAGVWNIARALSSGGEPSGESNPLDIHSGRLRIVDGRISTSSPEGLQSTGFDVANTTLHNVDAALEFNMSRTGTFATVNEFHAELPREGVTIESLTGEFGIADNMLRLDGLDLATSRSRLSGSFVMEQLSDPLAQRPVDLRITSGSAAMADIRPFLPSLLLADRVALEGHIHGTVNQLTVDDLEIARGDSRLLATGSLTGLPDSLGYSLTTTGSSVNSADLAALLPDTPVPAEISRLGRITLDGEVTGGVRSVRGGTSVRVEGDIQTTTDAGTMSGNVLLVAAPNRPISYTIDMISDGVNPGLIVGNDQYNGSLNGRLFATNGVTLERQSGTEFQIGLSQSTFAGRSIDSLQVSGLYDADLLTATVGLRQDASRLEGDLLYETADQHIVFDGELSAFDLRKLIPDAPFSRISGPVSLDVTGTDLASIQGRFEADLSESAFDVQGETYSLPAGPITLTVAEPGGSEPVVGIKTPMVEVYLDTEHRLGSAVRLGEQWADALARTVQFEVNKPRSGPSSERIATARNVVPTRLERFESEVVIRDANLLRALVPQVPDFASGTTINASGLIGSDSLSAFVEFAAPRFVSPTISSGSFDLSARINTAYAPILSDELIASAQLRTRNLRLNDQVMQRGSFDFNYADRVLHLDVDGSGILGAKNNEVALSGDLIVHSGCNHLSLDQLHVDLGGFAWEAEEEVSIDVFSDALLVRNMTLAQPEASEPQRLSIRGALSTSPSDTLYADLDQIDVGRVANLGSVRPFGRELGGRIAGRLEVTSLLQRPEISGTITIPEFSLGQRLLGRVDLTSQFIPEAEDVQVNLRLARPDTSLVLTDEFRLEENDLVIDGTVRFPGRNEDGSRDAGHLDLGVDITRADMFFFDFLFSKLLENSSGFAVGRGTITGDFSYPLFNAELHATRATTTIPEFGLQFEASGPIHVDSMGIHLEQVQLEDKSTGTGVVSGSVLFNDYRFFSLDLDASLNEIEIIDVPSSSTLPFFGHIWASGTATVEGPLNNVFLRSTDAVTTPNSEIFIPIRAEGVQRDRGFLVYADSLGQIPEQEERTSLIGPKPESERSFVEGLEMSLNIAAPPGSAVHLVFDPTIGDAINADGSADIQLSIEEGRFQTFGTFTASGGDYLFTAGEVFTRRFEIEPGGTLSWDGDPLDAQMNLVADYRTRASLTGLGLAGLESQRVPLVIRTDIGGRLHTPSVSLAIDLDTDQRTGAQTSAAVEALRPLLNDPERQALYASSVLLTGTFLLAPADDITSTGNALTDAADELLFTSLSQLVSSRLNLFLNQALASDNVELLFGLQPVEALQRFDLTYGVALRLLDERLVIRGEGVYQQYESQATDASLQGELAVEVRLSDKVSLEVFYRRESELLGGTNVGTTPYGSYGAGISFETAFTSWRNVLRGMLGRQADVLSLE